MPKSPILYHRILLAIGCAIATGTIASQPHTNAAEGDIAPRVVAVVSDRSALETVAGAHAFLELCPQCELALRTPEQIEDLTDDQISDLWKDADTVLLLGVFGESVSRMQRLLAGSNAPPSESMLLAMSGDPRLAPLSRIDSKFVFEGLGDDSIKALTLDLSAAEDVEAARSKLAKEYPNQAPWLQATAYRDARGPDNVTGLLTWIVSRLGVDVDVIPPRPQLAVRFMVDGRSYSSDDFGRKDLGLVKDAPWVAILDYDSGDRAGDRDIHLDLSQALAKQEIETVSVLARWGEASVDALRQLASLPQAKRLVAVVTLQDFVIGGGEGREDADTALENLNVPVLKAIRMPDQTQLEWSLSTDGVPWDHVHNRIAMPELQGVGQPHVIALAGASKIDPQTGLRLVGVEPVRDEIQRMSKRIARWHALQSKPNSEKRVAIVYYNHPPGRHNIGADNLDVPETLVELLKLLDGASYDVGKTFPVTGEAILEPIQATAVNLPNDAGALKQMHQAGTVLRGADYATWFESLPTIAKETIVAGPLARVEEVTREALAAGNVELARDRVDAVLGDTQHVLEGLQHPLRARAIDLADQLSDAYGELLHGDESQLDSISSLTQALTDCQIEGLSGWGPPPGKVMSWDGDLLVPGLTFGNVFLGPQPPRGWEIDEELLHANLSFPVHHQYLAWYHYVRDIWKADVLIHVGRHSTAEFLPGKRNGLSSSDDPQLVLGDLPSAYIYIVDGVGEGIQAKRRGHATIIDHLTPALATTPLYDELLELRQLVESFETAESGRDSATQTRAVERIRELVDKLNLRTELVASMQGELEVRGITFEQVEDDLLVHEVGHYLTHLQEDFMPLGLHVFGRDWSSEQTETMLKSIFGDTSIDESVRKALVQSPAAERKSLLEALAGRFVAPGPGNDPIRTPAVLPTGRNFHALGGEQTPTRLAWDLGQKLAKGILEEAADASASETEDAEALILWASDTVRDEGAMVAMGLSLLGVEPVWNSRGIVTGIHRMDQKLRRDVTFVTSGLFRDLFSNQLVWLDRAWLLTLDASSKTIIAEHPELEAALDAALSRLDAIYRDPGDQALEQNQVAAHWVRDTLAKIGVRNATDAIEATEASLIAAGRAASLRVFGNAPGGHGAGINALAERSGAWDTRSELADTWRLRMGHAYGVDIDGIPAHDAFDTRLTRTSQSFLGRASNLYGLLDNNDAFDYLGGLSMAVESRRGAPPKSRVISHANPKAVQILPLESELLTELRGRELNPAWISPLMNHGYAGARTMGSEFMENLWGWQVTNPEIVKPWVWDEVKRVYIDDGHEIGLDEFLDTGNNVHVKSNMLAILLVAVQKEFWKPSPEVIADLSRQFAELVNEHGLPGSGHTRPDHPVMTLVTANLSKELASDFQQVLQEAQAPTVIEPTKPTTITELTVGAAQETAPALERDTNRPASELESEHVASASVNSVNRTWVGALALAVFALFAIGIFIGGRQA